MCCREDEGELAPVGECAGGGGACASGSTGVVAGVLGMVLPVVLAGEKGTAARGAGWKGAGGPTGPKRAGMGAAERSGIGAGMGAANGRDGGGTPGGRTPGGSEGQ